MSAATNHTGAALLTSWQANFYIPIFFFFLAFSPSSGQR
jgi:hypothetical protein